MNRILIAAILAVLSTSVLAEGGNNNNPWQPVSDDECSVFLPSGIDEDKCEVVNTDQSGITYLCSGYTAFCPADIDSD